MILLATPPPVTNTDDIILIAGIALGVITLQVVLRYSANKWDDVVGKTILDVVNNIAVAILLIFSIYLCVASIVAIPEFQYRDSETVDNTELTRFNRIVNDSILNVRINALKIDTFKKTDFRFPASENRYDNLNKDILTFDRVINDAQQYLYDQKHMLQIHFEVYLQDKPGEEQRNKYILDLVAWYQVEENIVNSLAVEATTVNDFVQHRWDNIIGIEKNKLLTPSDQGQINKEYFVGDDAYKNSAFYIAKAIDIVQLHHQAPHPLPDKPREYEQFGIFDILTDWLLKTESISLALIAGLFGFGLLGAISSSFIRQKNAGDGSTINYTNDLIGMLIAGISSAIVVFLAVKGSIVILVSKDANINPYLVFFICLVAAVYNEEIWAWAKDKLFSTLNGTKPETEPENPKTKTE